MNQNKPKTRYEAVGFVEALIAIAVAGIASIVLMTIAANTIAQVVRNETADKMTEVAIQGSAMVKKIADDQNSTPGSDLFPPITGNINNCFAFQGSVSQPQFQKSGDIFVNACNYDSGDREQCKDATLAEDEEFFRIYCVTPESDVARGLVVGKIVVGLVDCDSVIANSRCELSDYEYYTAVKVGQDE